MLQKRMFKVLAPMDKNDGTKWWLRCGSAFVNKDNSINVYLDALPLTQQKVTLQLRELTEEEMRERADKRASYASRGTLGGGGIYNEPLARPSISAEPVSDVPF